MAASLKIDLKCLWLVKWIKVDNEIKTMKKKINNYSFKEDFWKKGPLASIELTKMEKKSWDVLKAEEKNGEKRFSKRSKKE